MNCKVCESGYRLHGDPMLWLKRIDKCVTLSVTLCVTDTVPETLERSLGITVMVPETVTTFQKRLHACSLFFIDK